MLVLVGVTVAAPTSSRGAARLLDDELRPPFAGLSSAAGATVDLSARPAELLAAAGDEGRARPQPGASGKATPAPESGSLDFDLLGAPPPPPPVDDGALRLRRGMLTAHQAAGIGLLALELATTAVGQLNYSDRFAGGPGTGKYQQSHAILAYTTLAAFALTASLALFAPAPPKRTEGFDRVTLHKIAMFSAAAMMVAQGVLGVVTSHRDGYQNHETLATIHLAIGYATLAAIGTGVGALVF